MVDSRLIIDINPQTVSKIGSLYESGSLEKEFDKYKYQFNVIRQKVIIEKINGRFLILPFTFKALNKINMITKARINKIDTDIHTPSLFKDNYLSEL
jgi:hypothetical protein